MSYPANWPRCPNCGDYALDGHITCGRAACDEGGQRRQRERDPQAILAAVCARLAENCQRIAVEVEGIAADSRASLARLESFSVSKPAENQSGVPVGTHVLSAAAGDGLTAAPALPF